MNKLQEEFEELCKICNRSFSSIKGLSKHISHTHKIEVKKYYDEYIRKIGEGLCIVCKNEVKFNRFGYHTKTCSIKCSNKIKFPVTKEFWKAKGLTDDESIEKIKEIQSTFSKQVKNRPNNMSVQYFLNKGMSEPDAISALKNRQSTRTLEKAISKYGELEGTSKWLARNKAWSKNIEDQYKAGKFSKSQKEKIWRVTSAAEIELADFLQNMIDQPLLFGKNQLKIFYGGRYYYYDICNPITKRIIEYNGDYWHANPIKYPIGTIVHSNKLSEQIWEADLTKLKIASELGYTMNTIWESDYLQNKKEIMIQALNFLNGRN